MASRLPTEPPRGMRDILPAEAELRDWAAGTILTVYRRHGFRRIETPALESLAAPDRRRWRGEREAHLQGAEARREARLGRGRRPGRSWPTWACVSTSPCRSPASTPTPAQAARPFRAIQIGPVWRAERPAEGPLPPVHPVRHRHPRRGVGDRRDRADPRHARGARRARARRPDGAHQRPPRPQRDARWCGFQPERHASVLITLDKLDKIGAGGVERRARGGRASRGADRGVHGPLMRRRRHLAERDGDARGSSATVDAGGGLPTPCRAIASVGAATGAGPHVFDPSLVRGMGYYTGTIFEIAHPLARAPLAGGGRYDGMIGRFLGQRRAGVRLLDRVRADRRHPQQGARAE